MIEHKTQFLVKAIEEAQETNRFLDTKAGALVGFESALLIVIVSSLLDPSKIEPTVSAIYQSGAVGYLLLLAACFVGFACVLIWHVIFTLRIVFPKENPLAHVALGDFEPHHLFFLSGLDPQGKMLPSLPRYFDELMSMSEGDVLREYIFELMKLSYVRKVKNDRLALSFKILSYLVIWAAVLVVLYLLGAILY